MSTNESLNSSESENACVVCFKNVDIFSIGACDHPVCFECSTRMRVLCRQNECPICRQDLPKVIFTKNVEAYGTLIPRVERSNLQDRKFAVCFCSPSIQRAYYRLLEHNCSLCQDNTRHWPFKTFQQLKDHMRREHELFYCELCVENLRIFTFERRCYTRSELALHKRKGDVDNTSHRGHPLCQFCDIRYVDSDELFRHLRRDHLFCHFCDADGKHQYYQTYEDLRAHFMDEHFLCEEGDCKNEKFTSAFRTDIDLKGHMAQIHSKHLRGAAHKQARMLDIEFTLAPRPRPERGNNRYNQQQAAQQSQPSDNRGNNEGAVGYDSYYMEPGGSGGTNNKNAMFVNPLRSEDFPSLGNNDVTAAPASSVTFTSKFSPKPFKGEDFPSLGFGSRAPGLTITGKVNAVRKNEGPSSAGSGGRVSDVTITRTVRGQSALERTQKNFPTLGDNSGSSTVKLSVNSGGSSHQDRGGSKGPNVSIHVNNSSGAITTRIRSEPSATVHIRPKSTEDFPALGKGPAAVPPQWITTKPKKQPEPKASRVAPAPVLPPSGLMDFPALSSKGKGEPKAKNSSSVEVPMSNSWVNLNSFNSETKSKGRNRENQMDRRELGESSRKDTGEGSRRDTGDGGRKDLGESSRRDIGEGSRRDIGEDSRRDTGNGNRKDTGEGNRKDTGEGYRKKMGEGYRKEMGEGGKREIGLNGYRKEQGEFGNKRDKSDKDVDSGKQKNDKAKSSGKNPKSSGNKQDKFSEKQEKNDVNENKFVESSDGNKSKNKKKNKNALNNNANDASSDNGTGNNAFDSRGEVHSNWEEILSEKKDVRRADSGREGPRKEGFRQEGFTKEDFRKADFTKGDFTKGDFKGDFTKGDFTKGDVTKGDFTKGDSTKGDFTKEDFTKDFHQRREETRNDSNTRRDNSNQMNGMMKKRSELNIDSLQSQSLQPEDFPALGKSKPPPGFNFKPPPGLSNFSAVSKKSNSANIVLAAPKVTNQNDLTFTNSSGQSYSILPQPQYCPPPNFQFRNKNLIESFMFVVQNNEVIKEFKCYSDLFRNGSYPAEKYYDHCKTVMGENFDKIFTELLVLLPNIEKQQELYKIHAARGNKKGLDVCATCKQVILSRELRVHLSNHTLDSHFPVLGQTGEVNSAWRK